MIRHTLDQLEVLEAIEKHGTFARAGQALGRVPSAVSYAVRSMEEQLGVALFERLGNRTALTPAGQRVLEAARGVLAHARGLERLAGELREGWEPDLQVVIDGAYPMAPVMEALSIFTRQQIQTRVRLDIEYQEGVPARWHNDGAALMLILDFDPEDDPLTSHPLPPLPMVLVAAPTHPLAGAPGASLEGHFELVVKDSAPHYARRPKQTFHESQHIIYLSDFHSKRLAALSGVGFGWLPAHLIEDDLARGTLVELPGQQSRWIYHPQLVHRSDVPLGRAAALLAAALLGEHQDS